MKVTSLPRMIPNGMLTRLYGLGFLFGVGVMVGHWLAAFKGFELHRLPGGWVNVGIWVSIVATMLMQ